MGGGEILEQGTHWSLLDNESGPVSALDPHVNELTKIQYAQLVQAQKLTQEKKGIVEGDDEGEKTRIAQAEEEEINDLTRQGTGRSLASALVKDVNARRDEARAEENKPLGYFYLVRRMYRINRQDKWIYITGTFSPA